MHFNSHRDSGRTGFLRSFVMICGWRRSESAAALRHKRRSRWSSVDRTPAAHDGQLCNSSRVISTTPVRLVSPSAVKLHFTEVSGLQDWSACELKSAVIRKSRDHPRRRDALQHNKKFWDHSKHDLVSRGRCNCFLDTGLVETLWKHEGPMQKKM